MTANVGKGQVFLDSSYLSGNKLLTSEDNVVDLENFRCCEVYANGRRYLQDRCGNAVLYNPAGQEIVSVKDANIEERWIDADVVNGMRFAQNR